MRLGGSLGSQGLDMSKPLLNGSGPGVVDATDEDAATMVAAIQDHIASCGKNMQESHFAAMGIKEERFPCDYDHMYASMAEHDSAAAAEVRQLKELLLLHLDLIQQQSEQIVNKDKQLNNLRHENDMLRQRLERMDRRVTLNHNKRQPVEVSANPNDSTPGGASDASATVEQQGTPNVPPFPKVEGSSSPRGSPLTVGTKHLTLPERSSRSRKSSWSSDTANSRRSAGSDRGRDSAGSRNRNDSPSIAAKRSRVTQSRRETNDTDEPEPTRQKLNVPVVPLNTPVLFYVPGAHDDAFPGRGKTKEEPCAQSLLEVPSWRIKPCTSCYSMEGTENLEDEVFLKRHQRLELDERRRKRWDIQRLREQRQYEKLRLRQSQTKPGVGGGASGNRRNVLAARRRNQQQEPLQLWPDPEEVQFIEVDNFLPVTAFGVPVPAFAPMVFELPWVVDREAILEEEEEQMETDQHVTKVKQEVTTAPSSPALPPPPPPPPPPQPTAQSTKRSHQGATRTQPGRRSRGASAAATTRTRTSTRRR